MNNSWKYIIVAICILIPSVIKGQTTFYYKLTKKIQNGVEYTNTGGGQFISFLDNTCYDSDKYGISVGNGELKLDEYNSNSTKTYVGNSYFGNAVYRFKSDLSILNIIVNKNLIYVYKRDTPPTNQTSCTLIKHKESNETSTNNQVTYIPMYDSGYDNTFNSSYTVKDESNVSSPKTKVRNKCPYCTNGERIQHESVGTYGIEGPRVYCNKCNQSWSYGTVHMHHKCNHCNGKGYTEYEY